MVAVSQPSIADYERQLKEPQREVSEALSAVFWVSPEFFYVEDGERFSEDDYNFRRRLTATERLKKKVAAQASLFSIVVRKLSEYVRFPVLDIPSYPVTSLQEVEEAAHRTRVHWGLDDAEPIDSMTRLMERAGVVLTVADRDTATKVNAFSRYGATSIVVLNHATESGSRSLFDLAHEAGHGVLHYRAPAKPIETREKEADYFAGAFLLPRRPFMRDWMQGRGWGHLLDLKRKWGASIQAIIVRARQLGLINAAQYRRAFQELGWRGWRTDEPEDPAPEKPELFDLALATFSRDIGKPVAELATSLYMSPELFASITGVSIAPERSAVASLANYRDRKRAAEQENA
jgi:Zn-dependent peptidase ImmA (M78 family)